MKIHADMGISATTVTRLREMGHDTVHLRERDLQRTSDREVMDIASREERAVLTLDLDFADLMAHLRADRPSVILLRLFYPTSGEMTRAVENAISRFESDLERGAILSVETNRCRLRVLPIKSQGGSEN